MEDELYFDIEILPQHFMTLFGADRSTLCSFGYRTSSMKKAKTIDLLDFQKCCPTCKKMDNPFDEEKIVKAAHKIMSNAKKCIGHYSDKFDFKYMNTKFMQYNLPPINYVALEDTWKIARSGLKLSSNRLDNIARFFKLAPKLETEVIWWYYIIMGKQSYMKKMSKYCRQDVDTLYEVHQKIKALKKNVRSTGDSPGHCPECNKKGLLHSDYMTVGGAIKYVMICRGRGSCGKSWTLSKQQFDKYV